MEKNLSPILKALEEGDTLSLKRLLEEAHPQDLLLIWDDLNGEHRYVLLTLLPKEKAAEVFANLPPEDQAEYLKTLPPWRVQELLEELSLDDLADALQAVEEEDPALAKKLKEALDPKTRAEVEELTQYEEDEAGGLMTPEYVAVRASMTVEDVLRFLRRAAPDAETIYYLYVVDEEGRLMGVLSLRDLIVADPRTKVAEIMNPKVVYVRTDTDQEEVARLMADYDFTVLPVVDEEGRLVGIVTVDDILDVLEEEATEDIHKLAAAPADVDYARARPWELFWKRIGWLSLLFVSESLTSNVIAAYEDLIAKVAILAAYFPLIIGTGGNVGSQVTTLVVRALGTRELDLRDFGRVLLKELLVGLLLGLTMGGFMWLRVATLRHDPVLAVAVGLAMVLVAFTANLIGTILPFLFRRLGVDPALTSSPFITVIMDVTGLLIYFQVVLHFLPPLLQEHGG
jgi:magnesium transporter